MASIISIKLNLVPGGSPGGILPRVRVSQGDAEDRIIQFELFDGLTPADMSDVDQCYIGGVKPDGNGFTVSCTLTSNVATAILTDQATVLAGEIRCKLYLLSATGSVRSASFTFDVDPDPLADAGTSDTDITAIVQAAAMYANNASESAEAAAQAATGAATAGATAGQAAAEAVVNNKLDKLSAAAAWVSGTEYTVEDIVIYDNLIYKCILDHTASSSITPEDTTYWESTTFGNEICSLNSNFTNIKGDWKVINFSGTYNGSLFGRYNESIGIGLIIFHGNGSTSGDYNVTINVKSLYLVYSALTKGYLNIGEHGQTLGIISTSAWTVGELIFIVDVS